jgi:hypothetical protein
MKTKLFISIAFYLCVTISIGQTDSVAKKKQLTTTKWQIGVNVNNVEPLSDAGFDYIFGGESRLFNPSDLSRQKDKSSSFGLVVSYKIRENCAIRLGARRTSYKIDETYNFNEIVPSTSGSSYLYDDAHFRQSVISIMPGIIWDMQYKKINFYCGFQFVYKKYSSIDFQIRYTEYSSSSNTVLDITTIDFKQQGGFSIGVGPAGGFSVNVYKGVCIGAEFSTAYSYYKTGGERTKIHTSYSGVTDKYTLQNSYETFKFSTIASSINISYNF